MRHAIFPGSFDPFTKGHESLALRALGLFDRLTIAIGLHSGKQGFFPVETRQRLIGELFKDYPSITVLTYETLTVDLCQELSADFILRGLRTAADFEYERAIAHSNGALLPGIETVFLLTLPEHSFISSTIVREIMTRGGDPKDFVPELFLRPKA